MSWLITFSNIICKGEVIIGTLKTAHGLAGELLKQPNEFLTVQVGEDEYEIDSIKRVGSNANNDDRTTHLTLVTDPRTKIGNIIR